MNVGYFIPLLSLPCRSLEEHKRGFRLRESPAFLPLFLMAALFHQFFHGVIAEILGLGFVIKHIPAIRIGIQCRLNHALIAAGHMGKPPLPRFLIIQHKPLPQIGQRAAQGEHIVNRFIMQLFPRVGQIIPNRAKHILPLYAAKHPRHAGAV